MANVRTHKGITPQFGERTWVDDSAVVIGDVQMGEDCSVWPMTVIRGDMHKIRIGDRCSIQDGSVLHITHASDYNPGGWPLILGDDVTVGHKALLHGCTIGSRVLVGMGCTVMDGALVPPGKRLESGYLYVGSPCKQARALSDKEKTFFKYTAANYVKLKDEYLNPSE
jgi:carbonic anhydrase/acetyltransferase-like protein (isoleucine patch superfamily)